MKPTPHPAGTVVWVDLATADLDGAVGFYHALLGWSVESEQTEMGRYVIGSTPAGTAAGMMEVDPEAPVASSWTVLFGTDDIDATHERALSAGATSVQLPMAIPGGDRVAVLIDPAGAEFGLMQSHQDAPMASGAPGTLTMVETDTRDLVASREFYEYLFGWVGTEGQNGFWTFRLGDEEVAGMMAMPPEVPPGVPSYWMPYFRVDDVDAVCRQSVELGGTQIVPPTAIEDVRFAVVTDITDAMFGVLQEVV